MKKLLLCIFLSSTAFMLQASVQPPNIVASVFLAPEYLPTKVIERILSARGIIFPEPLKNFRAKGGDIGIGYDNTEKLFLISRTLRLSMEEPGKEKVNGYNQKIITISDGKLTPTDTRSIIETIRKVWTSNQK
jgi:hypothetical protein